MENEDPIKFLLETVDNLLNGEAVPEDVITSFVAFDQFNKNFKNDKFANDVSKIVQRLKPKHRNENSVGEKVLILFVFRKPTE